MHMHLHEDEDERDSHEVYAMCILHVSALTAAHETIPTQAFFLDGVIFLF